MICKKIAIISVFVVAISPIYVSAMEVLDDTQLSEVNGQAGAYIDLELRLNHFGTGANKNTFDTTYCTSVNLKYCRLAISPNNRTSAGNKQWLVFKGIQGTIIIQNLKIEGADLLYAANTKVQPVLKFTFNPERPILFRNVGYDSLAIETDTAATDADRGYLIANTYPSAATFDGTHPRIAGIGREEGFTGLTMHGNLAVNGSINLFACTSTHPRC